ncbi:MAG: hypothetical protein ACK5MY_09495 [Jhaorihella sp.]
MAARSVVAAALMLAAPASAQDLGRALELPAHRALMAMRDGAPLAPFETDGCSGGLSHGWEVVADAFPRFAAAHKDAPPWEGCCITHDRAYHRAGGADTAGASWQARLDADDTLNACVAATAGERTDDLAARYDMTPAQVRGAYATIAGAMYLAVRFGGVPCSGLPWRWGYGYASCTLLDAIGPAGD